MDRPEHHITDHMKERKVEKGNGRRSTLQGLERSGLKQTDVGAISRAVLERLLINRRGGARTGLTERYGAKAEKKTKQKQTNKQKNLLEYRQSELFFKTNSLFLNRN